MEVQGINRSYPFQDIRQDVKQTREQRLVSHEAIPNIKTPEEAQKLIDDVRHLLLYG